MKNKTNVHLLIHASQYQIKSQNHIQTIKNINMRILFLLRRKNKTNVHLLNHVFLYRIRSQYHLQTMKNIIMRILFLLRRKYKIHVHLLTHAFQYQIKYFHKEIFSLQIHFCLFIQSRFIIRK